MVGHSPVFPILLQIEVRMSIMAFSPTWTNSAGMLSTPADFLSFSAVTAASTSSRILSCQGLRIRLHYSDPWPHSMVFFRSNMSMR